ncbi:type I restriction endonuclease subunit R [Anaerobiospirillum succiniciproducens]|uniref:type I restriction endonuclease subunit R n=1 Tax=Anaerobiospirillum succiniciproducens TaxID=13335 RepID=UPI000422B735|nr:type I restriction endonuclease subunit R [Anaerobiospirillum succiniciproducens]
MADLKPEERARQWIDRKLKDAGWEVINRNDFAPSMNAVAIRETLMSGGLEADYVLFLNGKAAAVIEAKREEISLDNPQLIAQAENYTTKALEWVPLWENPIPFVFLSNGKEIAFKDCRKQDAKYEKLKNFKRPWDLAKALCLSEFAGLPYLAPEGLRSCQYEAISNLEASFKDGNRRALMVLATGSGKTFTACMMIYRMLAFTPMRRVLFLVDRTNLGNDAASALSGFSLTDNKKPLSEIFLINKLDSKNIEKRASVFISTIQRLYSALSGKNDMPSEKEEDTDIYQKEDADLFDDLNKSVDLPDNPCLPADFFDLIIIDECHRSIYSNWQKVLTYFKTARLVGLTATPIPETVAFFNKNIVANYSYEDSVKDNVNVGFNIYRIKTMVSEEGGEIETGDTILSTIRGEDKSKEQIAICDREFDKNKLNRSIVVPDQIRKVLQEYKDVVYTSMYPDREPNYDYLPKTLIFAVSEDHAKIIVEIAKEVFNRKVDDNKFVQRITYSCDDTKKLIQQFRYDVDFRIAVTVTLVATGTDVRPLEVLLFLNDIRSETLYAQMKGRGCRVITQSELRSVTPNASSKDLFYIIDAAGVTESEKVMPGIGPRDDKIVQPSLTRLFEMMALRNLSDDLFILLANKLSVIGKKVSPEDLADYERLCPITPTDWAQIIFDRIEKGDLPPFVSASEDNTERLDVIRELLENRPARHKLIEIARGYVKELPNMVDNVTYSGFSTEEAKSYTQAFKEYIQTHKDEIEALRLIYNHDVGKLTRDHIDELKSKLELSISGFTIDRLWNDFALLEQDKVKPLKSDQQAVTNLIQLVRYAYNMISELCPLTALCAQRFALWCGQAQRDISPEQKELFREIAAYIANNGSSDFKNIISVLPNTASGLLRHIRDRAKIDQEISSLNEFILKVA